MFYEPMLLEKRESAFDDDRYLFEPKIDGHRLLLSMTDGAVRLYTRHNNDVTDRYPELHDVPVSASSVVLDGEVAYLNPDTGEIEFESIMERFRMTKPARIREGMIRLPVHYYVFDILSYNGEDVRRWPLQERKRLLGEVLTDSGAYSKVLSVEGTGKALFDIVQQRRLEGIVCKRKDSPYLGRRSDHWLKVINYQYANVAIAGYRKDEFGWLAHHNGKAVGVIELAVPAEQRRAFYRVAQKIVTGEDRNYVYIQPLLQARVRFRNWYRSGMLRSPEFVQFIV